MLPKMYILSSKDSLLRMPMACIQCLTPQTNVYPGPLLMPTSCMTNTVWHQNQEPDSTIQSTVRPSHLYSCAHICTSYRLTDLCDHHQGIPLPHHKTSSCHCYTATLTLLRTHFFSKSVMPAPHQCPVNRIMHVFFSSA